ncbi:hypothetical protein DIS24_g12158 [Lasiodiplodia hormozganensis]|uniref:Uncharacterized protein n=1 Tax=Lasiodiplodia hormozganensis TaxID=869390 RepID=A0AA39TWC5_9PEZI|nr:hypothetical protein DIS24_g12158 [Lasiodiplodia hormozganensis]
MESERFDLLDYVNEQVLAEWVDADTCETRTLGFLSTRNKQDASLSFRVGLDASLEQAFMRFSMNVSVRVSGKPRQRQLLLVLPLHVLSYKTSALEYDIVRTSDIGESAPAVHDAGFSDSGFVLRAQFSLQEPGYVLMPKSNAKALRPSTLNAANNLAGIKSLSQALSFTLYIKPSDYAQQGIRMIYEYLRNDTLKQYPLHWDALYGDHGAQPVDWAQCELGGGGGGEKHKGKAPELGGEAAAEEDIEPPPPYVSEVRDYDDEEEEEEGEEGEENAAAAPPRTPSPPPSFLAFHQAPSPFAFPPSPALIPPFLLSPTQCSGSSQGAPSPEVLVERSVTHYDSSSSAYSSPREVLSAAADQLSTHGGSDVFTIPATPECLPEIRVLLEAQAAAREREMAFRAAEREREREEQLLRAAAAAEEIGRKRRATSSPAASPPNASGKAGGRRPETKRVHAAAADDEYDDGDAQGGGVDFLATAASALLSLHNAPTPPPPLFPPTTTTSFLPSYAALQSKLFPQLLDPAADTALPPSLLLPLAPPPEPARAPPPPPTTNQIALPPPKPSSSSSSSPSTPNPLASTLSTFLAHALALNPRLYSHPRLSRPLLAAGAAARNRDSAAFTRLRARIVAEVLWDADGTGEKTTRGEEAEWYVADMEALVGWMLEVDAEADVRVWEELVGMGRAARGGDAEGYRWRKGCVLGSVCVGFGEGEEV